MVVARAVLVRRWLVQPRVTCGANRALKEAGSWLTDEQRVAGGRTFVDTRWCAEEMKFIVTAFCVTERDHQSPRAEEEGSPTAPRAESQGVQ